MRQRDATNAIVAGRIALEHIVSCPPKGKDLTEEQAADLGSAVDALMDILRDEFPCIECDGAGTPDPHSKYPEFCPVCWGKGYNLQLTGDEVL